ncbi:sugar transferase [Nocardiopsis potens]|uniref:sugar transferase n=1 Tax=Nocardiopsis potens TaxID=1246458 RepID=UPI000368F62C
MVAAAEEPKDAPAAADGHDGVPLRKRGGPRRPPEEARATGTARAGAEPGTTGAWQVSGRSDPSWEESVRLDPRYVENWSPTSDVQILWKTWSAVIRGAGAYRGR